MTIVLCRHGTTDGNAAGAILSRNDPSLNRAGREQSERAHGALAGIAFDCAFSSPMRRCLETLEIVAPQLPYRCDERLREVDFGTWEGRTLEWLEINDCAGLARRRHDPVRFRPPGGESFADKSVHLRPFAAELLQIAAGNALVVAHRGTLGVLERILRDLPLESQDVTPLEPGEFHILHI